MRPLALPGRRRFLALAAAVPLTAAALQEEAEQWQKIEHQFNVVAQ